MAAIGFLFAPRSFFEIFGHPEGIADIIASLLPESSITDIIMQDGVWGLSG